MNRPYLGRQRGSLQGKSRKDKYKRKIQEKSTRDNYKGTVQKKSVREKYKRKVQGKIQGILCEISALEHEIHESEKYMNQKNKQVHITVERNET